MPMVGGRVVALAVYIGIHGEWYRNLLLSCVWILTSQMCRRNDGKAGSVSLFLIGYDVKHISAVLKEYLGSR